MYGGGFGGGRGGGRGRGRGRGRGQGPTEQQKKSKLYVAHFPKDWTEDKLTEIFSPFGQIESVHIMKDKTTGESRGAGFINYHNPGQMAIEGLADYTAEDGSTIMIKHARPRQPKPQFGGGGGFGAPQQAFGAPQQAFGGGGMAVAGGGFGGFGGGAAMGGGFGGF